MRSLVMKEGPQRDFLLTALQVDTGNPFNIEITNNGEVSCPHRIVSEMIQRYVRQETTILPYVRKEQQDILFLVVNSDYGQLLKNSEEIANFLVPTLAQPFPIGRSTFSPDKKPLGFIGHKLFPDGYYCFRCPKGQCEAAYNALYTWSQLDRIRPELLREETRIDAYSLRRQFQESLVLQNWTQAEETLNILRQGHYLSDENCHFLRIQWFNAQARWSDIWESADYPLIAGLDPIPAVVRAAMLTAFYRCQLAPVDGVGTEIEALNSMKINQGRMGTLLRFRAGLKGELFLRVFAYQATLDNDLEKLERLNQETDDVETQKIISNLLAMIIPHGKDTKGSSSNYDLALQSFRERLYDDSYLYILDCPHDVKRVQILLGIATMTEDFEIIKQGTEEFYELEEEIQQEVLNDPQSKGWAKFVFGASKKDDGSDEIITLPNTWDSWFSALVANLPDLDVIFIENKEEFSAIHKRPNWNYEAINNTQENILTLLVDYTMLSNLQRQVLKLSLPSFANFLLTDPAFPNPISQELYEYVISAIQTFANINQNNNELLLRLLSGLFKLDALQSITQWPAMHQWLSFPPSIKMSGYVLETLDLFCDYGVPGSELEDTWSNWVGSLANQFIPEMRTQVQTWKSLGKTIGVQEYILGQIDEVLNIQPSLDPLCSLDNLTVTIFSCREKAAKRAALRITERNPKITVNLCFDDRMNDQVKAYATNSDLAIVVTACTSHALTYGIEPLLKQRPVYPRSSGETGIIEILEEWAIKK